MKNHKKYLARSVMLGATAFTLVACVPKAEGNQTSEVGSDSEGKTDVTIFMPVMSYESDPNSETNELTQYVEEEFGLNINFETVNQAAAKEKRQLSLASGDFPDAYWVINWLDPITKVEAQKYGQEGVFIRLNDLIDEHMPNLKKLMEELPYLEKGITSPDGNIYALPPINEAYHSSRYGKVWINTEWLDNLGLEMPATTEEFRTVLQAFKNDDPNGNGIQDEIPLSGEPGQLGNDPSIFLMNAFLPNNGKDFINVKNGTLELAPMQEEWKEGLKYINSLYQEGLIDPAAYTQNSDAYKQLGTPGDGTVVLGAGAGSHLAILTDLAHEASRSYDVVTPLKGPGGAQFTPSDYGDIKFFTFAITNEASEEQAIALLKLADFAYSEEGTMMFTKGKEGLDWQAGGPEDIDLLGEQAKYATLEVPSEEKIDFAWGEKGPFALTRELRDSIAADTDEFSILGYERRLYNATLKYDGFEPEENFNSEAAWLAPEYADELNLLQVNLKKYIDENTVQFITGAKDIDKDWDNYIKGFDQLQANRYLEIYQESYDAQQ
ncbi:hypothetical protein [Jeotgalibaca sp. A122]|uniref:hypothetical protein n=1 Tax=Jeotgalibaca sp. A122 TaxID=3457322 RepID=UPI003FD2D367